MRTFHSAWPSLQLCALGCHPRPSHGQARGAAPQRWHPRGSGCRGSAHYGPGPQVWAAPSPFPPVLLFPSTGAPTGPWPALTFLLAWIHLPFFFFLQDISFSLTDIIFNIDGLYLYVIHPASFDVKSIWMVSYWCSFPEGQTKNYRQTFPTCNESLQVGTFQNYSLLKNMRSSSFF